MKFMSYLLLPFSAFVLVSSFFTLIVPVSIVVLPLSQPRRLRITSPFWQLFGAITLYVACLARLKVIDERPTEIQKMPIPPGLYIANHQSFMDIPVLMTRFTIAPIMKKEVLYIPIFGLCGYSSGALIVDRSKKDSRKKVLEAARYRLTHHHKSLQYYPEGTRQRESTDPKPYEKIKRPLMKYAYQLNIPIYPVSIYGTRAILNPSNGSVNYGKKVGVKLHDGVRPADFENEEDFMRHCWNKVTQGHNDLKSELN